MVSAVETACIRTVRFAAHQLTFWKLHHPAALGWPITSQVTTPESTMHILTKRSRVEPCCMVFLDFSCGLREERWKGTQFTQFTNNSSIYKRMQKTQEICWSSNLQCSAQLCSPLVMNTKRVRGKRGRRIQEKSMCTFSRPSWRIVEEKRRSLCHRVIRCSTYDFGGRRKVTQVTQCFTRESDQNLSTKFDKVWMWNFTFPQVTRPVELYAELQLLYSRITFNVWLLDHFERPSRSLYYCSTQGCLRRYLVLKVSLPKAGVLRQFW